MPIVIRRIDMKHPLARTRAVIVSVDGTPVRDCIAADEVEGWADHYVREDGNRMATERGEDGYLRPRVERLHGNIEISLRD